VAIHGLHGHAWDSFASDFDLGEPPNREINWLQDILPGRILKKSRSMLGTELSVRVMTLAMRQSIGLTPQPLNSRTLA